LPQVALSSAGLFRLEASSRCSRVTTADTTAGVFERAAERLEAARAELADMRERVEALEKQA
jgi:hypothetical protein